MFCRFVAVDGLSFSDAVMGAMMVDVRKVLDGTYTAVSSLNASYWERESSFIIGGGTGGLGAIKAADGATSLYQNIASADTNSASIVMDKYHHDYKSGFQPKRHLKFSALTGGFMRTVVNSSNTTGTYEAFGLNFTTHYNNSSSSNFGSRLYNSTVKNIEVFASKYWIIFVVNYDSTSAGYMGNVVWAFLDFESDKQQEYSYTHSTWAGGQSTYPGFSWVVKNNRRDSVDIDNYDTFAQSMVGYAAQSNQKIGVQYPGRLLFNTNGLHNKTPYFSDNIRGMVTLPLYPQVIHKIMQSDSTVLNNPLYQVMAYTYGWTDNNNDQTGYMNPGVMAKVPFLYRTADNADYQGSPVTVGSDTYRVIRWHKSGYNAGNDYDSHDDNEAGGLACYVVPQTIGGV